MKTAKVVLLFLFICLNPVILFANDIVLLFPVESDKQNEKIIGEYIEKVKGWRIVYKMHRGNENDIVLQLAFSLGEIPDITINVDAGVVERKKDTNEVTGSRIKLVSFQKSGIKKGHPKRDETLELLNQFSMRKIWPQKIFLDGDGDIILSATIYIPEKDVPIHAGQVLGEIERMITGWKDLYRELEKAGIQIN